MFVLFSYSTLYRRGLTDGGNFPQFLNIWGKTVKQFFCRHRNISDHLQLLQNAHTHTTTSPLQRTRGLR